MLSQPAEKYRPYPVIDLPERQWPSRQLTQAPRWLSTDLRDGNQALATPMDSARKLEFWQLLVRCGFKEIEVAFPAASQTDFDFVRLLIDQHHLALGHDFVAHDQVHRIGHVAVQLHHIARTQVQNLAQRQLAASEAQAGLQLDIEQ